MEKVITIYKFLGETPLEALERTRIKYGIPKNTPMTYAGRLDPLAEGLLIILIGDECKEKEKYLNLDKEYEIEIVLGIQTDSHDVLGIIEKVDLTIHEKEVDFKKYICKFTQKYPAYSSKVISMRTKPEQMPTREVEIYSIDMINEEYISAETLVRDIVEKIKKVRGDFRQKKILESWQNFLNTNHDKKFRKISLNITCSSGTYMRTLAHNLGGIAFSIKRKRVGEYTI